MKIPVASPSGAIDVSLNARRSGSIPKCCDDRGKNSLYCLEVLGVGEVDQAGSYRLHVVGRGGDDFLKAGLG